MAGWWGGWGKDDMNEGDQNEEMDQGEGVADEGEVG
jgi:hypothetical protein